MANAGGRPNCWNHGGQVLTFSATTALSLLLPVAAHTSASNPPLRLAVFLLTTTAIVFRSEVAILLACHVTYTLAQRLWLNGRFEHIITLLRSSIIPAGVIAVIIGLSATIYIDTFFWQSPNYIWPELSAFFFNVFPQGDSIGASAWGTSPWHWYISNALPRLLLNPLLYVVLWFFGLWISATSRATLDLLAPNLAYVIVYSFLPHKESRFIFPVLPSLTLAGALPLSWIWIRRHKVYTYRIISAIAVLSVLACALVSNLVFLLSSSVSYPGADALNQLHEHILDHRSCAGYRNMANIKIHLDNLSIQTGITSFLERADLLTHFEVQEQDRVRHSMPTLVYDKSPIDPSSVWEYIDIDYVISEHPPPPQAAVPSSPDMEDYQWNVIATIYGLAGSRIHLLRAGQDTFHSPKYVPNRSSLPAARDESKNNNDDNADLELREAIDNRPGKDEENNGQSDNENKYWQSGVDALLVAMYDGSSVSVPSAPTARTRGRGQSRIEQASVFFRQFMRGGGGGGGGSSSSSRRPITTFHPPSPSSSSHFPTPKNGESPAAGGWERKSENDGRWPGLTSGWWVDVDWKVRLYVCERIRRPQ